MTINIRKEIMAISDEIITTRRDIHKYPELGFEVHRTAELVADKLGGLGLNVQTNIGKTGVVADLDCGEGPIIALRADMDALPVQETGDCEYKSVNDGMMHACGHDGHTAILLGAAKVLVQKKDKIRGTVTLYFSVRQK